MLYLCQYCADFFPRQISATLDLMNIGGVFRRRLATRVSKPPKIERQLFRYLDDVCLLCAKMESFQASVAVISLAKSTKEVLKCNGGLISVPLLLEALTTLLAMLRGKLSLFSTRMKTFARLIDQPGEVVNVNLDETNSNDDGEEGLYKYQASLLEKILMIHASKHDSPITQAIRVD